MFSTNEILDMGIKLEKNGEAVYRDAIEKVSNPELITLLEWMADEEVKHANWFAEYKLKLDQKSVNPFMEKNIWIHRLMGGHPNSQGLMDYTTATFLKFAFIFVKDYKAVTLLIVFLMFCAGLFMFLYMRAIGL